MVGVVPSVDGSDKQGSVEREKKSVVPSAKEKSRGG